MDGWVYLIDLAMVASAFGSRIGGTGYKPYTDLDMDGQTNIVDIVIVATNYGARLLDWSESSSGPCSLQRGLQNSSEYSKSNAAIAA